MKPSILSKIRALGYCVLVVSLFMTVQYLGSESVPELDEAARKDFIERFYASWRQDSHRPASSFDSSSAKSSPDSMLTPLPMEASPGTDGHTFLDTQEKVCRASEPLDLSVNIYRGSATPENVTVSWQVMSGSATFSNGSDGFKEQTEGDISSALLFCPSNPEQIVVEARLEGSRLQSGTLEPSKFQIAVLFDPQKLIPGPEPVRPLAESCNQNPLPPQLVEMCTEVFGEGDRTARIAKLTRPVQIMANIPDALSESIDLVFDTEASFELSKRSVRNPCKALLSTPRESASRSHADNRAGIDLDIDAFSIGIRCGLKNKRFSYGGAVGWFDTRMSSLSPDETEFNADGRLTTLILSWTEEGIGFSGDKGPKGAFRFQLTHGDSKFHQDRWADSITRGRSQATARSFSEHWHGRVSGRWRLKALEIKEKPEPESGGQPSSGATPEPKNLTILQSIEDNIFFELNRLKAIRTEDKPENGPKQSIKRAQDYLGLSLEQVRKLADDLRETSAGEPSGLSAESKDTSDEKKDPYDVKIRIDFDLLAALNYEYSKIDPFVETGDAPLRLSVRTQKLESLTARADARMLLGLNLQSIWKDRHPELVIESRLGIRHFLSPRERYLEAHWVGLPENPFTQRINRDQGWFIESTLGIRLSLGKFKYLETLDFVLQGSQTFGRRDLSSTRLLFGVHATPYWDNWRLIGK